MKGPFISLFLFALITSSIYAFSFNNGTTPASCGFTNLRWKLESDKYFDDTLDFMSQLEPIDTIDAGTFGTFYLIITDLDTTDSLKSFTYTLAHIPASQETVYRSSDQSWFESSIPDTTLEMLDVEVTKESWADTLSERVHFFPILTISRILEKSWNINYQAVSGERNYFIRDSLHSWMKFRVSYRDHSTKLKYDHQLSRFEYKVAPQESDTFDMRSVVLGDTVLLSVNPEDTLNKAVVFANNPEGKSILFVNATKYHEDGYSIENDSGTLLTRSSDLWGVTYNRDVQRYTFDYKGPVDTDANFLDSLVSHCRALRLLSGELDYTSIKGDSLFGEWRLSIPVSGSQEIENNAEVSTAIGDTLNFIWGDPEWDGYISKIIIKDLFAGTDFNNNECLYSSVKVIHDQEVSILKDVSKVTHTMLNSLPVQFSLYNVRGQEVASFKDIPKNINKTIGALSLSHGYYILKMVSPNQIKSIPLVIK